MYSKISTKTYCETPCPDSQLHCCPNYVYRSVETLTKLEMPESLEVTYCRTVGILQSINGQVYMCGMNSTGGVASELKIRVSLLHLESSKYIAMLQSIVMPCPVQIFGSIQWVGENPVVYAKLIQVLTASKALQMKDTMDHLVDFICHGNTKINI